ncbi:MAG TPA: DegT/DnrJ/EryC1/StrS family aminotransferase, partial [Cyclobacteriaceae bacterium]|nr:DegT/DnrJ/EryC1/StrS family aminotransferase [Cyclobacteriaceae bacterium]
SRFEKKFAEYMGVKHAVTTVNGSVSLRLALLASGVSAGDEVIVPPVTFIATASVVVEINCIPVFVDIDPDTLNIDPDKIEEAITPRTRAIIPVHFAGLACDMDRIMNIAREHSLIVIEDACHAHGAEYKGKKLGSIGHAGCFSFQSSKNMASGEGGIVITNDDSIFELADSLHNVGRKAGGAWYEHYSLGCNYRMTQFQAAILEVQLSRLESEVYRRNENGLYLDELLKNVDGITPMKRGKEITKHSYHLYPFRYDRSKFRNKSKAEFAAMLAAEGVPCFMGYPLPLHKQDVFQDKRFFSYLIPENVSYRNVNSPESERICYEEGMWILQQAMLGEKEDMEDIVKAILKIRDNL